MYKKILFLCCFYQAAAAQSETVVTVEISVVYPVKDRWTGAPVADFYLRCYKEYIVERLLKIDFKKIKTPAELKPPFYNDTSYYFINTALQKYVPYKNFSAAALPDTAAQDLALKPLGIQMRHIAVMDSAVRIADTVIRDTSYIRYRCIKHGPRKNTVITGYLLPVRNTSSYSYHRPTELAADGRFAWVETMDKTDGHYYLTKFKYETREIPTGDLRIIRKWMEKKGW
ncbi:hypothetical protein [Chitinophaga niabensis]|uniref:Uncharacterized protein n=1 Tax=Chitinophaga niabensis TaxID=536979 RepID=A0A1N6DUF8_9BACT|nr:hypothetical protein [Chitinophaga niabensis]SIN74324.1 hypothetical protein SAMN04488055_1083 [Chitinophaga niabensis]